jgi:hypothetical protein
MLASAAMTSVLYIPKKISKIEVKTSGNRHRAVPSCGAESTVGEGDRADRHTAHSATPTPHARQPRHRPGRGGRLTPGGAVGSPPGGAVGSPPGGSAHHAHPARKPAHASQPRRAPARTVTPRRQRAHAVTAGGRVVLVRRMGEAAEKTASGNSGFPELPDNGPPRPVQAGRPATSHSSPDVTRTHNDHPGHGDSQRRERRRTLPYRKASSYRGNTLGYEVST